MHALRVRRQAIGWLAAGVVAGGLVVGGAWYATSSQLDDRLLADLTGRAAAQEIAPPASPKPTAQNSRRPAGVVTEITAEPAAFTIRSETGDETTFQVLDTTVFMAGNDRPYRFDLLKQGDQVTVRGGAGKATEGAQAAAPTVNGKGKNKQARAAGPNGMADEEPIARQVMVRPAGEKMKQGKNGQAASRPASSTDGGNDATRQ